MSAEAFLARWRARGRQAMISVHRGRWDKGPENSLGAIAAAADCEIVEIDTQLSADHVPMLMHDPTLERMTGETGAVADSDSGALGALRLRFGAGGSSARRTDQTIPALEQALAVEGASFFDIDVKYPAEVEAVAAYVAHHGLQHRGTLKLDTRSSDDIEQLKAVERRHGVTVMAKVVLPDAGLGHISRLVEAGVAAAELWFDDLDQLGAACTLAADRMAVSTYTLDPVHCCGLSDTAALNDPDAVWGRLLDAGVTILMTDRAPQLAGYMRARS